jgi:hypothetical protein
VEIGKGKVKNNQNKGTAAFMQKTTDAAKETAYGVQGDCLSPFLFEPAAFKRAELQPISPVKARGRRKTRVFQFSGLA